MGSIAGLLLQAPVDFAPISNQIAAYSMPALHHAIYIIHRTMRRQIVALVNYLDHPQKKFEQYCHLAKLIYAKKAPKRGAHRAGDNLKCQTDLQPSQLLHHVTFRQQAR